MSNLPTAAVSVPKPSIIWPSIMIILGFFALCVPIAATLGVARVVGWLLLFEGVAQVIHAFRSEGLGHFAWKFLIALLYLVTGVYFLLHPLLAAAAMTLAMSVFFFAQGLVDIVAFSSARKGLASGWMLFNGIISVTLAVMIWRHWLSTSLWVIGTLVGINLLMTGTTRLMMAFAVRRLLKNGKTQLPAEAA